MRLPYGVLWIKGGRDGCHQPEVLVARDQRSLRQSIKNWWIKKQGLKERKYLYTIIAVGIAY
jgi:hypothetical protein